MMAMMAQMGGSSAAASDGSAAEKMAQMMAMMAAYSSGAGSGGSSDGYGPMGASKSSDNFTSPYGGGKAIGPFGGKGGGKLGKAATKNSMAAMSPEAVAEAMKAGMSKSKPGTYKTTMCRFFEQTGVCPSGFECTYAHSQEELTAGQAAKGYKMKLCKFWEENGTCDRGASCTFAHGINDMRAPGQTQATAVDQQASQATAAQMAQMQQMAMMYDADSMDPMALQAQNYMAGVLPKTEDEIPKPGEVRYSNAQDANNAVKRLNGQLLHGRPMELRLDPMSQDGTKVIVENLASSVDKQVLKNVFKSIGKIEFAGFERR
eukprot:gnl/TRDRNA2_/TRDRNA2_165330_c0_seq1.p1 gnl/TRDRNA2_/TRDRNA2_165330_c0~~gnl/TRDRNA2_/TRDRNA2_165330_c0_seq1.p1  ORF type:complete len:334 (-),score=62.18 gnl/TRDRNA2_/TRDRNA2_165330_c0_seq1:136-1089(-)